MTRSFRFVLEAAALAGLLAVATAPALAQFEGPFQRDVASVCDVISAEALGNVPGAALVDIIGDYAVGFGADDFNPCPTNRVYLNYDRFHYDPDFSVRAVTLGLEKSFLDGLASIEVRVPHFRDDFDSGIGDLSIVGKYAFLRRDNLVVSGGLDIRLPTSEFSEEIGVAPFIGWTWTPGTNWLLQGHHAITFIADDPFSPVVSTDVAASYVIGLDAGWLKAVVPQVGLHYFVPTGLPGDEYSLNLSIGAHAVLERGLQATLAVGFPLNDFNGYDRRITAGLQWNFGEPPPPPPPPP